MVGITATRRTWRAGAVVLAMALLAPLAGSVPAGAATQQAKLTASDGARYRLFGRGIAVSGDTMVVGATVYPLVDHDDAGAAYVFIRSGAGWVQQAKLTASDGASDDLFGFSVAVSGDTVVVGAHGDDVGPRFNQGSAYVFTRSGTTWTQQAKLIAPDGANFDAFGISVAVSGDTALVAGRSTYPFIRSGTTWVRQAKLTAPEGAVSGSLALSGNTAVVGTSVFVRNGAVWTRQAKLTRPDGAAGDGFGISVDLSGDTVVVGAPYARVGTNDSQGSAYVFTRGGTTWTQQAKLTASDGAAEDYFGYSVALSGDTALVGSLLDDVGANVDQGSAYVFTRSGATWVQQPKLTASDGEFGDEFGVEVGLSGDTAVVGAWRDAVGDNPFQGSAYVFTGVEKTPPVCVVTGTFAGPPKRQEVTVQDVGSGLATITNIKIVNGTVAVAPFTPGTRTPVKVTATKTDQTKPTVWEFDATDVNGNTRHCA